MDLLFNCDLDELRKSKYFPLFCVFAAVDVALFCAAQYSLRRQTAFARWGKTVWSLITDIDIIRPILYLKFGRKLP